MNLFRSSLLLVFLALCLPLLSVASEMPEDLAPPPVGEAASLFQGIETWSYPSGLRVHFKSAPQSANVYITAMLPVGSRHDPQGREGLAHLVEHLVFTDHRGKTEAEIKQAVAERGGRTNATTSRYMTRYYVDLPTAEWQFAINWMHDLLRGHRFDSARVEAERKVVMLEKSYRQPDSWSPLDQLQNWLWSKGLLVKRDFWEREFGLRPEYRGVLGSHASIRAINVDDVQQFYDRYYGPQNVTIMIVGNMEAAQVKALVDRSFGTWAPQGERVSSVLEPVHAVHTKKRVAFKAVANVHQRRIYKIYFPTGYDMEMAHFSARFLQQVLNQKLRGEHKATYGVTVNVESFGGHALLSIAGNYTSEDLPRVDTIVESTLEDIRQARMAPQQFVRLRERILNDLTANSQTARSLAAWCTVDGICNQDIYQDSHDRLELWAGMSPEQLGKWFSQHLGPEQAFTEITKPLPPAWLWLEFMGPLGALSLVVFMLRRQWSNPSEMTQIRYLATLRYSWWVTALALAAFLSLLVMIAIPGYWLADRFLVAVGSVDSYFLHVFLRSMACAAAVAIIAALGSAVPRQIQLFNDNWRINFLFLRSITYRYDEILSVTECSLLDLILRGRILSTLPLHWGFGKGLYIQVGSRFGYFIRVDNTRELLEQMKLVGRLSGIKSLNTEPSIATYEELAAPLLEESKRV